MRLTQPFTYIIGSLAISLVLVFTVFYAYAEPLALPINMDYTLLRVLTIHSAYTDANQTARVFESEDGCTTVTLSDPKWREAGDLLRLETMVDLRAGKALGENCLFPIAWQGYVILDQYPKVDGANWHLSFKPINSNIYNLQRKPIVLSGIFTTLMEQWVYPYLAQIRIDLAPPVADLKQTLLPMVAEEYRQRMQSVLESMRPGVIRVNHDRIRIDILIDTPSKTETVSETPAATPLSKGELDRFIRVWETWDSLLVHMILALIEKPLIEDEKQILLDTLLDTRHRFSTELARDQVEGDFVKKQFLWAWEQLAPIFRKHLTDASAMQSLAYLTFFTASDALDVLNRLGPALGLEISREGLIRLARLLGDLPAGTLEYPLDIDRRLRDIFGFEPLDDPPAQPSQPPPTDSFPLDSSFNLGLNWRSLLALLPGIPLAEASQNSTVMSRLKPWIVPKSGLDDYLGRVKGLLKKTAENIAKKKSPLKEYAPLFERIVISTAWQESCFRQFHTKNRRLVYLRSYNGSSVGLMQINERVWRGIYDVNRLRWEIDYNAMAGCEILTTYIKRYALKRYDQIRGFKSSELAGIVYAMYNGGPSDFKKFLTRLKSGKLYLSDRLFKEKFTWVQKNQWSPINRCLVVG